MSYPTMTMQPSVPTLVACGRRKGVKEAVLRILSAYLPNLVSIAEPVLSSLYDDLALDRLLNMAIRRDERQLHLLLSSYSVH